MGYEVKQPKGAIDLFRGEKAEWLRKARLTARILLMRYETITIEDVLRECPQPTYMSRNLIGSVFHHDDFCPVGYAHATKRSSHKRVIRTWGLKDNA